MVLSGKEEIGIGHSGIGNRKKVLSGKKMWDLESGKWDAGCDEQECERWGVRVSRELQEKNERGLFEAQSMLNKLSIGDCSSFAYY